MSLTHQIPSSLILSPFYMEGDSLSYQENRPFDQLPPFYYEWLAVSVPHRHTGPWPWETEDGPSQLWKTWETLREVPEEFFRQRKPKLAEPHMIQLTANLLSFLFWSEGKPVSFDAQGLTPIGDLAIAPVNLVERLQFICSAPSHYHAFVQLNELYNESRKKRALFKIKRNG